MVFGSSPLFVVFKTTGGRLWTKPWGLTGLTRTQKANRKKQLRDEHNVMAALKQAAEREPRVMAKASSEGGSPPS